MLQDHNKDPALDEVDENRMPLIEHLRELKQRLMRAAGWVLLAFCVTVTQSHELLDHLMLPAQRFLAESGSFIFIHVAEGFLTQLKTALFFAIFLASPGLFFELWQFIAPGLYQHERRLVLPFVFVSTILFVAGAAFAYSVVLPYGFQFFLGFADENTQSMPSIGEYLKFVTRLLLVFGTVFQLPLFIVFLARLGIVDAPKLVRFRPYAIVLVFAVGAFLTPPDVVTQIFLALPMAVLYEVGIAMAMVFGQKPAGSEEKPSGLQRYWWVMTLSTTVVAVGAVLLAPMFTPTALRDLPQTWEERLPTIGEASPAEIARRAELAAAFAPALQLHGGTTLASPDPLSEAPEALPPLYYSYSETETHVFITYHALFGERWSFFPVPLPLLAGPRASSTAQVVLRKDPSRPGQLHTQLLLSPGRLETQAWPLEEGTSLSGLLLLKDPQLERLAETGRIVLRTGGSLRQLRPASLERGEAVLLPGVGYELRPLEPAALEFGEGSFAYDAPGFDRMPLPTRWSGGTDPGRGGPLPYSLSLAKRDGAYGSLVADPALLFRSALRFPDEVSWSTVYTDHSLLRTIPGR